MTEWKKYSDFGRIVQLRNEGRELLGEMIFWTVKRDGQNVLFSKSESNENRLSSHEVIDAEKPHMKGDKLIQPDKGFINRVKNSIEYDKAIQLLEDEPKHLYYYENVPEGKGPTKIEPNHKYSRLILIDIFDPKSERYMSYNYCHQVSVHYRIPIVPLIDVNSFTNMDDLFAYRDSLLSWCKRHRREGVVGKTYYTTPQYFFKEKIDLPEKSRDKVVSNDILQLPMMPQDKLIHAIEQAKEQVERNGGTFTSPKDAMPVVALHVATQAREHCYSTPKNLFSYYQAYLEGRLKE